MLPIYGLCGDEPIRLVEAADCHIDATRLLVADPADRRATLSAERSYDAARGVVGGRCSLSDSEVFNREENPRDGLSSRRPPAVRAMANEDLVRRSYNNVPDYAATTAAGRFSLGCFQLIIPPT